MPDVIENLHELRQSCDDLEGALRGAANARQRFGEVLGRVLEGLGPWVTMPVGELAAGEPLALPAPPPAAAVAPKPSKPKARPVREARTTPTAPAAETKACEKHTRRSHCRGAVKLVVKCTEPGCGWECYRCAKHPAKSPEHVRRAHVRHVHHGKRTTAKPDRRAMIAARAKGAAKPEPEPSRKERRPYGENPSHRASKLARERAKAGGDPGAWRGGRVPELLRCTLPDVEQPKVLCGALVMPAKRAEHLADVHHAEKADKATLAAAFEHNNDAGHVIDRERVD